MKLTDINLAAIHTLGDLITARVEQSKSSIAIYYAAYYWAGDNNKQVLKHDTWEQVYNKSLKLAQILASYNDIGIFLPTSYVYMLIDNACLLAGLTSLNYHPAWQMQELAQAISLQLPSIFICTAQLKNTLAASLDSLNIQAKILVVEQDLAYIIFADEIIYEYVLNTSNFSKAKIICFTSGTSGSSKGVVLEQKSLLICAVEGYKTLGFNALNSNMFHYLPFSHVFARIGLYISLIIKANNYFLRSINHFSYDIKHARPSLLFAVPKLMDKIDKQIQANINKQPKLLQKLIKLCIKLGYIWQKLPVPFNIIMQGLQRKLFAKLNREFGGKLKLLVVGGASICSRQKQFFEALGIRVCEGYGMTESAGVTAVQPYYAKNNGSGKILPSVKYSFSAIGELLLKGDILMLNYLPKDEYSKGKWFNTGDIASIKDGYLHITGRSKELIITKNGENIYPARIENLILQHEYIEDVCIVGDSQECLLALIVIEARYNNLDNVDNLHQDIKIHLSQVNKQLPRFEKVFDFLIVNSFVEDKLLTITHKKRRSAIVNHHKQIIDNFYINKK